MSLSRPARNDSALKLRSRVHGWCTFDVESASGHNSKEDQSRRAVSPARSQPYLAHERSARCQVQCQCQAGRLSRAASAFCGRWSLDAGAGRVVVVLSPRTVRCRAVCGYCVGGTLPVATLGGLGGRRALPKRGVVLRAETHEAAPSNALRHSCLLLLQLACAWCGLGRLPTGERGHRRSLRIT